MQHLRDLKQEISLFVGILVLRAVVISCSVEMSMKKFYNHEAWVSQDKAQFIH